MANLMLNPNLRVRPVLVDGDVTAYLLVALVKGRGRLQSAVEIVRTSAHVTEVLKGLVDADADVAVDESAIAPLVDLGVLIQAREVSRQVRFSCPIEAELQIGNTGLTVNPEVEIMMFDDFARRECGWARVIDSCEQIAVVTDPVTDARWPYWLDDRDHELLKRLVPGAPPPADLDPAERGRFAAAGILIEVAAVASARQRASSAADLFARCGYAELPQVLPVSQIASLNRYYGDLLHEGHVFQHDRQVSLRHAQHNEQVMRYYHHQLCAFFARVAGRPIKPSYGYFASYRRGATLEKHRDRKQCKFTASLLLDYHTAPSDDQVWPLYLELPATGEQIAVGLEPGGCLLFSGCEQPHYRHELRGERSTSFLLHYVDETFSGSIA